jgi:hypothetical protein
MPEATSALFTHFWAQSGPKAGPRVVIRRGVDSTPSRPRHSRRRAGATPGGRDWSTLVSVALVLLAVFGRPGVAAMAVSVPPDSAAVLGAFQEAQRWLRGGGEGEPPELALGTGVAVALRQGGALQGRASAVDASLTSDPESFAKMVRSAWAQAVGRMPLPNDALSGARMRDLGSSLSISLEVAWNLTPIDGATSRDIDAQVNPGVDGVAVSSGERWACVYPEELLAESLPPSAGIMLAAGRLGDVALGVIPPELLKAQHGLRFYRFQTIHVVQASPQDPPVFRTRGQRLVSPAQFDGAALTAMGRGLSGYLSTRIDGDGSLRGPIDPVRGKDVGTPPGVSSRALVAIALARASTNPAFNAAVRTQAASDAKRLRDALPRDFKALGDVAALVLAEYGVGSDGVHDKAPPRDVLWTTPELADGLLSQAGSLQGGWLAWASVISAGNDPALLDRAETVVRAVYRSTPPAGLVSHMPFLAWAEIDLARSRGTSDQPLPAASALRELADRIREHQRRGVDLSPADADLEGGILFPGLLEPWPTWHSARPVTFLAAALREPSLTTPKDRFRDLNAALSGVRFLRQLCADDGHAWMQSSPAAARWGVRTSMIDQRQPPEASASALLAVCELLDSMRELGRPAAVPANMPTNTPAAPAAKAPQTRE